MSIKKSANPGRELISTFGEKKFKRIPVETHFIELGENINTILAEYVKDKTENNDIVTISCKIVSITHPEELVVKKEDVKISPLARLIVRFVKKWPNDIGYSNPRKMQVAINQAGYLRIILAMFVGAFMKLLGKPGYFYRVAGNQINAIDGFTIGFTSQKLFEENAFLAPNPKRAKEMSNAFSEFINAPIAIIDGNNIENNIIGTSDSVDKVYSHSELKEILKGNPQGQEDDGNNTPILIVREL